MNDDLRRSAAQAVARFWRTRDRQKRQQGRTAGRRDHGGRSAVTGGKQLDGFIRLVRTLLEDAGLPDAAIHEKQVTLPGYFRPTKEWDLLVVADGNLIATLEFKSQVGPSFGNNFNNRTEEAIGSATDLWTAHREGAFQGSMRPWLGYFILLEEAARSTRPVAVKEPHFKVFSEFASSSYARRYEVLCQRLVRERLYDAACLLLSPRGEGKRGVFSEPNREVSFARFAASLVGHATGYVKLRGG